MAGMQFTIWSEADLIKAINKYGFLPFFRNSIEGFSIEEHIAPEHWYYSDSGQWDAWEWKGPVIQKTGCAYGKFFEHKAVYISKVWFPDFANYRRDGMTSMQGMMRDLQNIPIKSSMICLTVMLPLYPKNSNSSEITARAAIKVLIPLSQDCRSNAM